MKANINRAFINCPDNRFATMGINGVSGQAITQAFQC